MSEEICAKLLTEDILPIPVDQRYGFEDMEYLVEVIKSVSTEGN